MNIELSGAINTIVETALPKFSPNNVVLFVEVNATYTNHAADKEVSASLLMCYHRPHNYTKVFYLPNNYVGEHRFSPDFIERFAVQFKDKWVLESDHDSCWRDGTNRVVRRFEGMIMEKAEMWYPLSNKDYSTFVNFGISEPSLHVVDISRRRDENGLETGNREYDIVFKAQKIENKVVVPEVENA